MTSTGNLRPDDTPRGEALRDRGSRAAPWAIAREDDVLELIRRADGHALGRAFLQAGAQDAVAATFGVHAFLVDAARDRLARETDG